MINVSPIGRNASNDEREEFEKYDKVSDLPDIIKILLMRTIGPRSQEGYGRGDPKGVRPPRPHIRHWRYDLLRRLPQRSVCQTACEDPVVLTALGIGWDKTYSLKHIEDEGFTEIHFFGDKVSPHLTECQ